MKLFYLARHKALLAGLIIIVLTGYQLVRIIAFINVYGGIEHDGGWALSVSRSLAETGTYTSLVSTVEDPALTGGLSVDQKFEIQTADGRIWFRISDVAGTSIVFDALIIKLFGTSYWALVAGPLIFYVLLLLFAAFILYRLAGLGAVFLFHGFIFCYPHMSIFLSYQALREVPGIAMVLAAYLVFVIALQKEKQRYLYLFLAGLVAGLAINTKLLTLLSLSGIVGWLILTTLPAFRLKELIVFGGSVMVIPIIWEFIQLVVLTRVAGIELFLHRSQQRFDFLLDGGSGLRERTYQGYEFFWDKFFVLSEVTHPQRWVTALIFLFIFVGGGLTLLWFWRVRDVKQNLLGVLWLGWLANTIWFISLAKTGWTRHYWFGLILAMILLSALPFIWIGRTSQSQHNVTSRWISPGLGWILLALIGWSYISQPHVWGILLPTEIVPYWQEKQLIHKYQASLPWIIIPREQQAEVVDYINQMPPEANVYYPYAHKGAEIPPLTGRINYPLNRRSYPSMTPHPADILLVPSFIVSSWTHDPVMRQNLLNVVGQSCPQPVLKNDFYMICLVEELRSSQ